MIKHNKPFIPKKSIKRITEVLNDGWINYGKVSHEVENKLSNYIYGQSNCATLTVNGTSAIFIALKALNIKHGDEVIVPSYTCTALLNAIHLANAKAVICDISQKNLSFTKKILKPYISKKTKAIIVVHTFGIPCEIEKIKELNIPIIEDCSQSLGSRFKDGTLTGSKGDISIFSFYASKLITGGIGGAVTSKNHKIIEFIRDYIKFDTPEVYKKRFNFQISDINSCLMLEGLNNLEKLLKKKKKIANKYIASIPSKKIIKYSLINGINNYRFLLFFQSNKQLTSCKLFLEKRGIHAILPIENFELLHNYMKLGKNEFMNAEYISHRLLSIPIHSKMTKDNINTVVGALNDYFSTSTSI